MNKKTHSPLWLIAVLLIFLPLFQTANASDAPDAVLQAQTTRVLAALKRNHGEILQHPEQLDEMVDRLIAPVIDFPAMSKLVLGKHWKKATLRQRTAFQSTFRSLLKNTYTKSLKEYAGQNIIYFPARTRIKGNYATVYSEFVPGNGRPNIPVIYKLRQTHNQWKAYNLIVQGLSFVANYRNDFNREIQATSLDALIVRLGQQPAAPQVAGCATSNVC